MGLYLVKKHKIESNRLLLFIYLFACLFQKVEDDTKYKQKMCL